MTVTALDVGGGILALYLIRQITKSASRLPLPPGPKGLPLLGNILDIPSEREWETYATWKDIYGDIASVTVFGQTIVVINSAKHAFALLDQRSGIYSDRPLLWMGGELVGWRNTLALTPYGDRFRSIRKKMHGLMGSPAVIAAHPAKIPSLIELETHRFLLRILNDPSNLSKIIRLTTGKIILNLSHGYQVKDKDDPVVACVDEATNQFSLASQPGAWLVDLVPFLRHIPAWVPGAGFQRQATEWRTTLTQMADGPHNRVKEEMAAGKAKPSFTLQHLEDENLSAEEEDIVKWAAASLYSGGADTTVSGISIFFLAMTLFPEVQAKAQKEIDELVGSNRLPNFSDRKSLPYVEALVSEVFRWQPVVPMGLPHRVTEEDVYEGYRIPLGALVVVNVWQLLHDPEVYADPLVFNPDRFLGPNPATNPREFTFGFGRRACPGRFLADESVWLACASALAVFNIRGVPGKEAPKPIMTNGTISHPEPFPCDITPRSEQALSLIMSAED